MSSINSKRLIKEDLQVLLDKKNITDTHYYEFIRGKDVIVLGPGSNTLYVPNAGKFIDDFDVIVTASADITMLKLQRELPDLLGNRMDVVYMSGKKINRKGHVKSTVRELKALRKLRQAEQVTDFKYCGTKLIVTTTVAYKIKYMIAKERKGWQELHQIIYKYVPIESQKKLQTITSAVYHLLLHEPKSLYMMGFNFHMRGSLEGYYDKKNTKARRRYEDAIDISSQCKEPKRKDVDYKGAFAKTQHSQYLTWKTINLIYNSFDYVTGDPMFKEIMSMTDKEFKEANSLNIEDLI